MGFGRRAPPSPPKTARPCINWETLRQAGTYTRNANRTRLAGEARLQGRSAAGGSQHPDPARSRHALPTLVGKSEGQVRAMLGPPTSVEERAPGKTWHYRDGRCSVDVQLYPDVQTRQFGTLAYEIKTDDNSAEGRRDCISRISSRLSKGLLSVKQCC